MCGINGIIKKTSCSENDLTTALTQMNNLIIHRGPDEDGFTVNCEQDFAVGMAMRRLSIIDNLLIAIPTPYSFSQFTVKPSSSGPL